MQNKPNIVVLGLGYVGLPLATAFVQRGFTVYGCDTDNRRIADISEGKKIQIDLSGEDLQSVKQIRLSQSIPVLTDRTVFIVTVPTPVDSSKTPDFTALIKASSEIGKVMKSEDVIVYESTVYPGATRDICIPAALKFASQRGIKDIKFGYSPERVNPGDKMHRVKNVKKIVSGSDGATSNFIQEVYNQIIDAGTFLTASVEIAEASKIVENIQRDVNIALMNELDNIFSNLGIDTHSVIDAASTKWNFMDVRPGLVGGHCIGVDPYYMINIARSRGCSPTIIQGARDINESYLDVVVYRFLRWAISQNIDVSEKKIMFFGTAFKPNCDDLRNSKNLEAFNALRSIVGDGVTAYEPYISDAIPEKPDLIIIGADHKEKGLAKCYFEDAAVPKYDLVRGC